MRDEKKSSTKKSPSSLLACRRPFRLIIFLLLSLVWEAFLGSLCFFFCAGTKRGREIKWEMIKGKILFCWMGWAGRREENGKAICARSRDDVLHLSGVWRCFDDNF